MKKIVIVLFILTVHFAQAQIPTYPFNSTLIPKGTNSSAIGLGTQYAWWDSLFAKYQLSYSQYLGRQSLITGNLYFWNASSAFPGNITSSAFTAWRTFTLPPAQSGTFLLNPDTTTFRTFSDSKYLKNADSTAQRTFSDLKYWAKADLDTTSRWAPKGTYLFPTDTVNLSAVAHAAIPWTDTTSGGARQWWVTNGLNTKQNTIPNLADTSKYVEYADTTTGIAKQWWVRSLFVPYSGASSDVDLSTHKITVGTVKLGIASSYTGAAWFYNSSNSFFGILNSAALSSNRAWSMPDIDGTMVMEANPPLSVVPGSGKVSADTTSYAGLLTIGNAVRNYVPYIGANANVDVGSYFIKAGKLESGVSGITDGIVQLNDQYSSYHTSLQVLPLAVGNRVLYLPDISDTIATLSNIHDAGTLVSSDTVNLSAVAHAAIPWADTLSTGHVVSRHSANEFGPLQTFNDALIGKDIVLKSGWVQEQNNPILSSGTEPSIIQTGNQLDMWYRDYPNGPDTVKYTYSTDYDMRVWATPQVVTAGGVSLTGYYPTVQKVGSTYYMFLGRGDTVLYLYNSSDKIHWNIMNSGNPVFTHNSDPTSGYYHVYSVGIYVDGSTWHLWIDGATSTYDYEEYYSYSDTVSLNWNTHLSASPISTKKGTFSVIPVPDRNSLLIVHQQISGHVYPDNFEQIRAMYVSLSDDFSLSASYHEAVKFPALYKHAVHVTDPCFAVVSGKEYNILLSYNYNQTSINQCYSNLTLDEFYDAVTAAPTTFLDQRFSTSGQVQTGELSVTRYAHFQDSLDIEGALNVFGGWTGIPKDLTSTGMISTADVFISTTGASGAKAYLSGNGNQAIIGYNEYYNGSQFKSLDTSKPSYQFLMNGGGSFDGWKIQRAYKNQIGALSWKDLIYGDTSGNYTIPGTITAGGFTTTGKATLGQLQVNASASTNIALNDTITSTVGVLSGNWGIGGYVAVGGTIYAGGQLNFTATSAPMIATAVTNGPIDIRANGTGQVKINATGTGSLNYHNGAWVADSLGNTNQTGLGTFNGGVKTDTLKANAKTHITVSDSTTFTKRLTASGGVDATGDTVKVSKLISSGLNALGRAASFFVSASNAGVRSRTTADFHATGTSDQTTIQEAIDSLYALGGGTVYCSEGTFYITAPIIIKSKVSIIGTGWSTIFQLANNCNMFQSDTTADAIWLSIEKVFCYGADSTGNCFNITAGYQHGDWYYNKILISHFKGDGIYIESGWHQHFFNGIIEACSGELFHAKPTGVTTETSVRRMYILNSGLMWNNLYGGTGYDALYFEGSATTEMSDVSISNCKIGNSDIMKNAIHLKSVDGFTISGNRIGGASKVTDTTYSAIYVDDDGVLPSQSGTIASNTFGEGDTSAFGVERYAIDLEGSAKNIAIGNNIYTQIYFSPQIHIASGCSNIYQTVRKDKNNVVTGVDSLFMAKGINSLGQTSLFGGATSASSPYGGWAAQNNAAFEINRGVATSTNSSLSILNLVTNQSGTANVVGAIIGTNSNLATTEKRIGGIVFSTNGATNTGQITFQTANAGTVGNTAIVSPSGVDVTGRVTATVGVGTATVGAGDSVQISITGLTTATGVAVVSYKRAGPIEASVADTIATYNITAAGKLTLFGKFGWLISYIVMHL